MTDDHITQIANRWMDAFNRHDLEALLSLYDDDAVHFSPKLKVRHPDTQGLIAGRASLRSWWQEAFDRLPTLRYEPVRFTPHADRIWMEYIRHVEGEPDLGVAEVLEIRNGLIVRSSVYHQ